MADWYGTSRSNYVKIKDMDALNKALEPWCINTEADLHGRIAFFARDSDNGGWPSWAQDAEGNEIEFEWETVICPHMEDGEILVIRSVGAEKLRYVTGHAAAFDNTGKSISLSLDLIYSMAANHFGVPEANITTAEY